MEAPFKFCLSFVSQTELITGVIELVGRDVALDLFQQTRKIEGGGGMMIKNGSRRRTPGGLYLQLLRDRAKEDHRIDEIKVRYSRSTFRVTLCIQ